MAGRARVTDETDRGHTYERPKEWKPTASWIISLCFTKLPIRRSVLRGITQFLHHTRPCRWRCRRRLDRSKLWSQIIITVVMSAIITFRQTSFPAQQYGYEGCKWAGTHRNGVPVGIFVAGTRSNNSPRSRRLGRLLFSVLGGSVPAAIIFHLHPWLWRCRSLRLLAQWHAYACAYTYAIQVRAFEHASRTCIASCTRTRHCTIFKTIVTSLYYITLELLRVLEV